MSRKDKIQKFISDFGDMTIKSDLYTGEVLDALLPIVLASICHITPRKQAESALIHFANALSSRFSITYEKITDQDRK